MQGRGSFDGPTYDSTYTSAFNTSNTTCLAGATFTTFKNNMLAAGEATTPATNDATEYCRRLAVRDGVIAGRNAAEASSTWNKIRPYGAGAHPLFSGNSNVVQFGVDLSGGARAYGGGWKVESIDFADYQVAAIRAESASANLASARGLWITGSTISHITGVPFNTSTHTLTTPIAGYSFFMATGVDTQNTKNVFFDTSTITNADAPFKVTLGDDSVVDGVNATHSYYLHPYLDNGHRQIVQNSIYDQMCDGPGLATGAAGFIAGGNVDLVVYNVEIKATRPGQAGDGFDFEGFSTNSLVQSCNIHNNSESAFLFNPTGGTNVYTMIVDSTFTNQLFGKTPPNTDANLAHNGGGSCPVTTDHQLWVRNNITKNVSTTLFACNFNTSPTDDPTVGTPNAVFGPDNTVH